MTPQSGWGEGGWGEGGFGGYSATPIDILEIIPGIYITIDDGSLVDFAEAYTLQQQEVQDATVLLSQIGVVRNAPVDFIDYNAQKLGNPFPFMTPERWKAGNKLEQLTDIYARRGTKQGMIAAIRYLTGANVTIRVDIEYCWRLGVSTLGGTTTS